MAQYNLGNIYRNGEGVKQDHFEAVKWFQKSKVGRGRECKGTVQYNLGIMYSNGKGVEQTSRKQ